LVNIRIVIGIIGGGSLKLQGEPQGERVVSTPYGEPSSPIRFVAVKGQIFALIFRHGLEGSTPPHRINYRANIEALASLGVKGIIGINSVGSLKEGIPPGSLVVPDDFLCLWSSVTFFDDRAFHVVPRLDEGLRSALIDAAKRAGFEALDRGVYVQTIGPRLETKAEVKFLGMIGDVVGMTMVHEAVLCCERGIPYASLCTVDNYAHGVGKGTLGQEQIRAMARQNAEKVARVLKELRL